MEHHSRIRPSSLARYQYVVTSAEGFVQRLATNLLPHGYWFYVLSTIPDHKDPLAVDEKLLGLYNVRSTRWSREEDKRKGVARIHYLRFERTFILIATHGEHPFFKDHEENIRDVRYKAIQFGDYAIKLRNGHASVKINLKAYQRLKAEYLAVALRNSKQWWEWRFGTFPYPSYAPIRRQAWNLWRQVNRLRKAAGETLIDKGCIRIKRMIVKPFGDRVELPCETESGSVEIQP
jgi:hypothetical protein